MARLSYCLLFGTSLLALSSTMQPASARNIPSAPSGTQAQVPTKNPAEMARDLAASGDMRSAIAMYNQALMNNPNSSELAAELTAIYRKLGQRDKALAIIQDAQSKNPDSPEVLTQLGYTLIDAGQYAAAVNVFDQLMAVKNNDPAAYNGKAVAFDSAGNHIAAQDMYRHALDLSPGSARIENNLAMSMLLNGQADEALDILQPLYKREPNNPTIRHNLAMAYGMTGDDAKALELNLIDLPPQAAKDNVVYYKTLAAQHAKKVKPVKQVAKAVPLPEAMPEPEPAPVKIAEAPKEEPKNIVVVGEDTVAETITPPKEIKPEEMKPSSGDADISEKPAEAKRRTAPSYPTKHGEWSVDLWRKD